jgi:hypothetical protein
MTPSLVLVVTSSLATAVASATITAGRAQSLVTLALAVAAAVVGRLALARRSGPRARGRGIAAVIAGALAAVLAGVHVASAGPIGSGSGKLGAIVALVLGLAGAVFGGLAIARGRRTA